MGWIDDQFYTQAEVNKDLRSEMSKAKPNMKPTGYSRTELSRKRVAEQGTDQFKKKRKRNSQSLAAEIERARNAGDTKTLKRLLRENYTLRNSIVERYRITNDE